MKYLSVFLLFIATAVTSHAQFGMQTEWEKEGRGFCMHADAFDLNRDGFKDVVVGNYYDTEVFMYNPYTRKPNYTSTYHYEGRMLAILDFNGDGNKDMITLNFIESDSLSWTYEGELLYYFGNDTSSIAIDTIIDYRFPTPVVYPEIVMFSYGYTKSGIRVGDVNGDGKEDMIISSFAWPNASFFGRIDVFLGKEIPIDSSDYRATVDSYFNRLNYATYFEVGDINGDGFDDIFTSDFYHPVENGEPREERLFVYYGKSNFSFSYNSYDKLYTSLVVNDGPVNERWSNWFRWDFSLVDVNNDGYEDIIISGLGYEHDSTKIHYGSPSGIDTIPSVIITDLSPGDPTINAGGHAIPVGDFNGDGWNDFILKPVGYKSFALMLGSPHPGNQNPYGLRGFINADFSFPQWAFTAGDYDNDGDEELYVIERCWEDDYFGYIFMMHGNHGVLRVEDDFNHNKPTGLELHQNYPNPFNGETTITYYLPQAGDVTIKIYDVLGAAIDTITLGRRDAGEHSLSINFEKYGLTSGIYLIELKAGSLSKTIKAEYLK